MMNGIKTALENTPPELSADLVDMGLNSHWWWSTIKKY